MAMADRENKERIISFRLPATEGEDLDKRSRGENGERRIIGVKSGNQLARKVVRDFLMGRLVYIDRGSTLMDPDVANAANPQSVVVA